MGTMIQSYRLSEQDFRGERFADWPCDLKGNNDLLALTCPDVVDDVWTIADGLQAALDELLAAGEVSSVEATQAHLDRIAEVDGGVHAFLHVNENAPGLSGEALAALAAGGAE